MTQPTKQGSPNLSPGRGQEHPSSASPSDPSSRGPRRAEQPSAASRTNAEEFVTDEATASFVRRVLCAHQTHNVSSGKTGEPPAIEDLLPPLTSSNEVDLQLYAFISIIIKEYVHTWYTRISPDHLFVAEVVQIIAHCTRALEERARKVDYESLILNDLASLLDAHVDAYRIASRAAQVQGPSSTARLIYHTLHPHPALGPFAAEHNQTLILEQQRNYSVYLQLLAQGIIAVLLPTEDLQNPCLRALISEAVADLIIGNFIGNRICESIFIYDSIRKAANAGQIRLGTSPWAFDPKEQHQSRLFKFGLVADRHGFQSPYKRRMSVSQIISTLFQYAFLAFGAMRILIRVLATSSSLPNRQVLLPAVGQSRSAFVNPAIPPSSVKSGRVDERSKIEPNAIAEYSAWSAGSSLISFPLRMPWLSGMVSLLQLFLINGPGRLGVTNNLLDRYVNAISLSNVLLPFDDRMPIKCRLLA